MSPFRSGATTALAFALSLLAFSAHAQSLPLNRQNSLFGAGLGLGARAWGMGGAFIAVADDATAGFWNPAGLCVLEDAEVSAAWQPKSTYVSRFARQSDEYTPVNSGQQVAPSVASAAGIPTRGP